MSNFYDRMLNNSSFNFLIEKVIPEKELYKRFSFNSNTSKQDIFNRIKSEQSLNKQKINDIALKKEQLQNEINNLDASLKSKKLEIKEISKTLKGYDKGMQDWKDTMDFYSNESNINVKDVYPFDSIENISNYINDYVQKDLRKKIEDSIKYASFSDDFDCSKKRKLLETIFNKNFKEEKYGIELKIRLGRIEYESTKIEYRGEILFDRSYNDKLIILISLSIENVDSFTNNEKIINHYKRGSYSELEFLNMEDRLVDSDKFLNDLENKYTKFFLKEFKVKDSSNFDYEIKRVSDKISKNFEDIDIKTRYLNNGKLEVVFKPYVYYSKNNLRSSKPNTNEIRMIDISALDNTKINKKYKPIKNIKDLDYSMLNKEKLSQYKGIINDIIWDYDLNDLDIKETDNFDRIPKEYIKKSSADFKKYLTMENRKKYFSKREIEDIKNSISVFNESSKKDYDTYESEYRRFLEKINKEYIELKDLKIDFINELNKSLLNNGEYTKEYLVKEKLLKDKLKDIQNTRKELTALARYSYKFKDSINFLNRRVDEIKHKL